MNTKIIKSILTDDTGKSINAAIKEINSIIIDSINEKETNETIVYGFHINSNESDPYNAVTYLEDAVGMTSAKMIFDVDKFSYGSWKDAFFMPRPCMVRYDGTVDYYLDENDYEKKENGEVSALGDSLLDYGVKYPGNAMMEWGRYGQQIWTKVLPDAGDPTSGSVYISNIQIDEEYTAYPFINNQGRYVDHFYTAIYNGSLTAYTYNSTVYYKLRSIPRRIVMNSPGGNTSYTIPWEDNNTGIPSGFGYTTVTAEINLCLNNNPNLNKSISTVLSLSTDRPNIGWFTEVYTDIQLINNLLILIGKSLNTQSIFGNGNMSGNTVYSINNGVLYTGSNEYNDQMIPVYNTLNKSGLFYGSTGNTNAVKVFGMENWWGNQFRRYAGYISKSNGTTQNYFIKQTFGSEDGSEVIGYNLDGTNYIDTGIAIPTSDNYIKAMKFINNKINTFLPVTTGATSSTYWCDYYSYNNADTRYARCGGYSGSSLACGAFYVNLTSASSITYWYIGTALSYKPVT